MTSRLAPLTAALAWALCGCDSGASAHSGEPADSLANATAPAETSAPATSVASATAASATISSSDVAASDAVASSASGPAVSASASTSAVASASASASAPVDPLIITLPRTPLQYDFAANPQRFTAAFDGSLRFGIWLRMLEFSRAMGAQYAKAPHFTFFVNACFYTTDPGDSDIGKAMSRNEVLVRRALTQQAINEGHDIGDHSMGHHDGRNFTREDWLAEFGRFHAVMDEALFEPVLDEAGVPVFPRFAPLEGAAARSAGAACETATDCDSGLCVAPTPTVHVCTEPCNAKRKCPTGMACGGAMFQTDTDVCLPVPTKKIELDGKVLFDSRGDPNLKHPRLKRYRIIGFRAPYLAANNALYSALAELGYRFDTSMSTGPEPPFFLGPPATEDGTPRPKILELALILHEGALTMPMDYNYEKLHGTYERMVGDYENALVASFAKGHLPFNVGHHFAPYNEGAYLTALEHTVEFALQGCPDSAGAARCAGAEVVSFRELESLIAGAARSSAPR
ncbi:MAG: hypothetical protein U0271_29950 [Polyangiaceae bacterium]